MNNGLVNVFVLISALLMIINQGLGSQYEPITIFNIDISQIINWVVILGFCIIVRNTFKQSFLVLILVFFLLTSKFLSVLIPDNTILYMLYKASLLSITFLGGIIYANKHVNLIYKQVMIFAFINAIMMILQLSNAGDWTQFLSTESTSLFGEKQTYDLLFLPYDQLADNYNVIQARPSGFLRSNNILSGFVIFGFALHFSREKKRVWWGTLILCAMMVLAGARIIYLCYLFIILTIILGKNKFLIKKAINSLICLIILLFVYYIFFPGLFIYWWTWDGILFNIFIRINNIIDAIGPGNIIKIFLNGIFQGTPTSDMDTSIGEGVLSSFSYFVKYIYLFIIFSIFFLIFYIKSKRQQALINPELYLLSSLCFVNFVLYPAAVIIILDQVYWFTAGFALCSLSLFLPKSYTNRLLK
jgi:hypothetical protein